MSSKYRDRPNARKVSVITRQQRRSAFQVNTMTTIPLIVNMSARVAKAAHKTARDGGEIHIQCFKALLRKD